MTPELASIALQFLSRVQLQGAEVNAFVTVARALETIATSAVILDPVKVAPASKISTSMKGEG